MRPFTPLLLAAVVATTGACASGGAAAGNAGAGAETARPSRTASGTNVIASAAIEAAAQRNMYDVIVALRPRWLQNSGAGSIGAMGSNGAVTVHVNGRPSGGLETLSGLDKSAVDRVLYYTLSEAQARYGSVVRGPVIDVRLKVGG